MRKSHHPTPDGRAAPASTGIAVVGMHRSGTSATAGVLRYLGVALGERFLPAQENVNDQGFWELVDVVGLHDRIFHWVERDWHDIRGVPEAFFETPAFADAVARARDIIRDTFADAPLWAIKDPRLSLFLPVWRQAAREERADLKCIITLRHPFEVVGSLTRRDALSRAHGLLMWGEHVSAAVRDSAGMARAVLDYTGLLADWRRTMSRVADELGLDLADRIGRHGSEVDGFLSDSLRRHRSTGREDAQDALAASVLALYAAMRRQADEAGRWSDVEAAAAEFDSVARGLVPHLHELLQHVYMHDARAREAHDLLAHGLNGKGELIDRIAADLESLKADASDANAWQQHVAVSEARVADGERILRERENWIAELRRHVEGLETKRSDLETQVRLSVEALAHARAGFDSAVAERDARIEGAMGLVQERDRWLGELRPHVHALEERRRELEVELSRLQGELAGAHAKAAAQVQVLEAQRESIERHCAALRENLATLSESHTTLERQRAELREELADARAQSAAQVQALQGQRDDLERQCTRLLEELGKVSDGHAILELQRTALREELDAARAEGAGREARIAELEQAHDALVGDLGRQIEGLEQARVLARKHQDELFDARVLAGAYADTLRAVAASRSWKITTPVRWLASGLRTWTGRGHRRMSWQQATEIGTPPPAPRAQAPVAEAGMPAVLPAPAAPALPAGEETVRSTTLRDLLYANPADGPSADYVPATDVAPPAADRLRAKVIAYYLPQFHPIDENDTWWGRGFTEWTNVTKAHPQFAGHHQPHLPAELGFYDLRLEETIRQQTDLATQYGVHGFCFHYYWFAGRRLLEKPLDVFLASDIDFPFCLCWANENWTRRWDGFDSEVLIGQEHGPDNDLAFIRDLEPFLRDPRYIRVDGRPLVVVYRPSLLPDAGATLERWRAHCREVGIGEIFLSMVQFDVLDPTAYGFDAAMEFPPHKLAAGLPAINHELDILNPEYSGHVVHYQALVDTAKAWPKPDYPLIRGVFPGWDNEARRPGKGYTFAFSTPDRYRDWLDSAVGYAEENPVRGERLVMVNAWNEWAEGAHLEPDRYYGRAYLQATRDVVEADRPSASAPAPARAKRIALVSHDAHPHGAQYLALHIGRELKTVFGFDVEIVLLGEGELTPQFEAIGRVHDAASRSRDTVALDALASRLAADGIEAAIVNTTVAGHCAAALKRAGLRVVCLIHELPGLIASYGLELEVESIARYADRVVFPASRVRDGFARFVEPDAARWAIRPQGLFVRSRHVGSADHGGARAALRRRLRIPADAKVVLAVGYGDRRKGVDTFCEVAGTVRGHSPDVHFVWVGHYQADLVADARKAWSSAAIGAGVHFVGKEFDTDDFYAGADVYALTSREDPFPSVLLESLAVGTPVIAFAGAGGADELLPGCGGFLVDEPTAAAFARHLKTVLDDDVSRATVGQAGAALVADAFDFRRYVFDLLEWCGFDLPRVSVVVPNFNYAPLLRERLESIFAQTLPPYEVIVLDDASTDDSVAALAKLRSGMGGSFRLVVNETNSGSVFAQWRKGAELARGDYLWIAEADDLAEPAFLQTVTAPLAGNPDVVMSYCESAQIGQDGQRLAEDYRYYTDPEKSGRWDADYVCAAKQEVEAGLAVRNTIPNVSAVAFRTSAFRMVMHRHFPEITPLRVAGDWLVYARILEDGAIAYSAQSLNVHRRHDGSVTGQLKAEAHFGEVKMVQELIQEMFDCGDDTRGRVAAYRAHLRVHFGLDAERQAEACGMDR